MAKALFKFSNQDPVQMNNFMKKETGRESMYAFNDSEPQKSCFIDESVLKDVFQDIPPGQGEEEV